MKLIQKTNKLISENKINFFDYQKYLLKVLIYKY